MDSKSVDILSNATPVVLLSIAVLVLAGTLVTVVAIMWRYIVKQHARQIAAQEKTNTDNDARREMINAQSRALEKIADSNDRLERRIEIALVSIAQGRLPHVAG